MATITRLGDGRRALVTATDHAGDLTLTANQLAEARKLLQSDRSALLGENGADLFVRGYRPPPRLLLIGAVHIAQALVPMATLAGFDVTIVDPRRAFATPERFPGAKLLHQWPDEALVELAPDSATAVVTLTHDPKLDEPALVAALQSPAYYVGALGSKRTHARRLARLREHLPDHMLERIHAPVGLDLGSRSPAHIAVSILAQALQVKYRAAALP